MRWTRHSLNSPGSRNIHGVTMQHTGGGGGRQHTIVLLDFVLLLG